MTTVLRYRVSNEGLDIPLPNSKKAGAFGTKMATILCSTDKKYTGIFEECQKIISSIPAPSAEPIKRPKYTADLRTATEKYLTEQSAKKVKKAHKGF